MAAQPPVTPARQMPGNYFQTPAPARTTMSNTQNQSSLVATSGTTGAVQAPTAPELKPIERAARSINDALERDRRFPELERFINQGNSQDYDVPINPAWSPYQKVKSYEIPDQIFEQYNQAQVATMMGLFAQLNHAWITIDNALYLWDYTHPQPEIQGYEEQPHTITGVKLVKPRPGVFIASITHLLVVATTFDIILIGLASERTPMGVTTVTLFSTNMKVPIRGLDVTTIEGSDKTGRIFFAGRMSDDVWELTYQQEEKWFANRCGKINHVSKPFSSVLPSLPVWGSKSVSEHVHQMIVDDTRNLLYTLSSKSTIRVFHLKKDNILDLCITQTLQRLKTNMSHNVNSEQLLGFQVSITSINPIPFQEASKVSLIANTSTGFRVFLSVTSGGLWGSSDPNAAPTSMMTHHVKAPPHSMDAARLSYRFGPGYFFCLFQRPNEPGLDVLLAAAPDTGRLAAQTDVTQPPKFIETFQELELGGLTEDIGLVTKSKSATTIPVGYGNELAVQYDDSVAEIAILTNAGVQTVRKRRLVDIFASIIRYGGTTDEGLGGEFKKFVKLYGRDETSATALAVACGQGSDVASDLRMTRISDNDALDQARKAFVEYGGKATLNENVVDQTAPSIDNVKPSPRHQGMALYIARLIRSTWSEKILREKVTPQGLQVESTVPLKKSQTIQKDLNRLKEFLNINKSTIDGLAGPEALARPMSKQDEVALQGEHRALDSLVKLTANVIEGLAFVQMLFDERVEEVLLKLPDVTREQVRGLTYEALFTKPEGRELAKDLVKAIVNRNIEKGSNVDTVADALRRRCGSFCSAEDVIIFKAQEQLKKATEAGPNSDRARALLNESLKLFEQVTTNLTLNHLALAVNSYIELQFYAGAIQLALLVANSHDPAKRALGWLRDGSPAQDPREASYRSRMSCYEYVRTVISAVDEASAKAPPSLDGQISVLGRRTNEAYDEINRSEDEVFQTYLYDWYLEKGWTDRLLESKSPFVATYLERKAIGTLEHADLLWKYFAQQHDFHSAAKVQLQLAESAFKLTLPQRIEYLSRAKANASTRVPGLSEHQSIRVSRQEVLRKASDLLDIADVQTELLDHVQHDERFPAENKRTTLEKLDGRILEISVLFNEYTEPGSYFDVSLMLYATADYRVVSDIEGTWVRFIQKLHEEAIAQENWAVFPERLRQVTRKIRSSEVVLSTRFLVGYLLQHHLQHRLQYPTFWIYELFLSLPIRHEVLVGHLEQLFFNDERRWSNATTHKIIAEGLVYVIKKWSLQTQTALGGDEGDTVFGNEAYANDVSELLGEVIRSGNLDRTGNQSQETAMTLREMAAKALR